MSTLTSPTTLVDLPRAPARERIKTANCSDGGRLTLEQRLDRVWEGLSAAGAAACPLCGGRMERDGEGAARCSGCGSALT